MTNRPALWRIRRDDVDIHLFGGSPPGPAPWHSSEIDAVLDSSRSFWNEAPGLGPESQALAIKYGVDTTAPLATRLEAEDRRRVEAAAALTGTPAALLAPVRPWLAAQLLRMAAESAAGTPQESSAEAVLTARARQLGIPVHSEFATPEALFRWFAALPPPAEVEYLRLTLDDLDAGPDAAAARHQRWAAGDLAFEEEHALPVSHAYPAFYEYMVVSRNRDWVPRIEELLHSRVPAFIVAGTGHLLGPSNLLDLLAAAGLPPGRI